MPRSLIKYARYEEFCVPASLAELAAATEDAIAHVAPAHEADLPTPVDFGGVVTAGAPAPARGNGQPETWWSAPARIPALYVVLLHDAICFPGQFSRTAGSLLLAQDRFIIDDSYHVRNRSRKLPDELLTPARDGESDAYLMDRDLRDIERAPGTTILLGHQYGHFGHFLLEGLARTWALPDFDAALPVVTYDPSGLRPWQSTLLEGLDVGADRLVPLPGPRRFERLLVPSRAYNLHQGGAPALGTAWERIGDPFDDGTNGRRVYLTRSAFDKRRALLNEPDVEAVFADRGFEVVHPQQLPIEEQLALARSTSHLAGSAGSAMYLSMFQRRAQKKLILSSHSFTFRDDQIISHLRDGDLSYFISDDEDRTEVPRYANYRVDVERLGPALDTWLSAS